MAIPSGAMVIGATARVLEAITGSATTWMLGNAGATNRFGENLGKGVGSWSRGILSAPMTYWNPSPLVVTAAGGQFTGGKGARGRALVGAAYPELTVPAQRPFRRPSVSARILAAEIGRGSRDDICKTTRSSRFSTGAMQRANRFGGVSNAKHGSPSVTSRFWAP